MEIEKLSEILKKLFRIEEIDSTKIYVNYQVQDYKFRLKKKRFRDAVKSLNNLRIDDFEIYSETKYEVSLMQSGRVFYPGDDEICKEDTVNKLSYSLSIASDEYLILVLQQLDEFSDTEDINRPFFLSRLRHRSRYQEETGDDLMDNLKLIIPRLITLKINSDNKKIKTEFETLSYSFLFNLGYNTDISYLPSSSVESLTRRIRIGRLRRSKIEDIEPPKRRYENDLILFYQKGISSESVDLQYLSFYHVIEHFFEKIYNEELISSIKTELMKPSFSYKRNKDISELIGVVQDKLRYKNEEFQINEPEALRLVLDRFISDFNDVKLEILNFDNSLVNYYKSNEVVFSKGNKVNFDEERSKVLSNLKERIYKTRNSIVHSKETDKERYLPFKHDKILQKEIVLMRSIAERIIIESSREL